MYCELNLEGLKKVSVSVRFSEAASAYVFTLCFPMKTAQLVFQGYQQHLKHLRRVQWRCEKFRDGIISRNQHLD